MTIQNVRLKDADGNVLHPETELKMIRGAEGWITPGFFVFGTYEEQVDQDAWEHYPALGVYRIGGVGYTTGIIKAFYVNGSGNIVAITDLTQFKPMGEYFAQ